VLESAKSEIIVGWCFLRKVEFDWRKLWEISWKTWVNYNLV